MTVKKGGRNAFPTSRREEETDASSSDDETPISALISKKMGEKRKAPKEEATDSACIEPTPKSKKMKKIIKAPEDEPSALRSPSAPKKGRVKTKKDEVLGLTMGEPTEKVKNIKIRTSPAYFVKLLTKLTKDQKEAVKQIGFGGLLDMDIRTINGYWLTWMLQKLDSSSCEVNIKKRKKFDITELDVFLTTGLPAGDIPVVEAQDKRVEKDEGYLNYLAEWRKEFNTRSSPNVNGIAEKLHHMGHGDVFKRNFVLYAISSLFHGQQNDNCNFKPMKCLMDTDAIKKYNWCGYVVKGMVDSVREWKARPAGFFCGPAVVILLCYLDRLRFEVGGKRMFPLLKGWKDKDVVEQIKKEETEGGFGKGRLRERMTIGRMLKEGLVSEEDFETYLKLGNEHDWALGEIQRQLLAAQKQSSAQQQSAGESGKQGSYERVLDVNKRVSDILDDFQRVISQNKDVFQGSVMIDKLSKMATSIHPVVDDYMDFQATVLASDNDAQFKSDEFMSVFKRLTREGDSNTKKPMYCPGEDICRPSFDLWIEGPGQTSAEPQMPDNEEETEAPPRTEVDEVNEVGCREHELEHPLLTSQQYSDEFIAEISRFDRPVTVEQVDPIEDADNVIFGSEANPSALKGAIVKGAIVKGKRSKKAARPLKSPYASRRMDMYTGMNQIERRVIDYAFCGAKDPEEKMYEPTRTTLVYDVYRWDIRSLEPEQHVYDSVVDAFSYILNNIEAKKTTVTPTRYFFSTIPYELISGEQITKETPEEQFVTRCSTELMDHPKLKMTTFKMVFFPVVESDHFYLVVINFKERQVQVIDNIPLPLDMYFEDKYTHVAQIRDGYARLLELKGVPSHEGVKKFSISLLSMPWQVTTNKHDCGVFMMRHMETFMRFDPCWSLELPEMKGAMAELRKRYCAYILMDETNACREDILANSAKFAIEKACNKKS